MSVNNLLDHVCLPVYQFYFSGFPIETRFTLTKTTSFFLFVLFNLQIKFLKCIQSKWYNCRANFYFLVKHFITRKLTRYRSAHVK